MDLKARTHFSKSSGEKKMNIPCKRRCATEVNSLDICLFAFFGFRGVDGSLHLTVPSMNRLNQTEPATFSIMPCWAFFGDSYFLYFIATSALLCRVEAVKSRLVHSIRDVIFPILKDRSARHYCCACGNLVLSVRLFLVGWFQHSSLEYCWITLGICGLLFKFVFWRLICDMQASKPLIPF
jgi:hypothetical protein